MASRRKLTAKQQEVLEFLIRSRRKGRAPTYREIGEAFDIDVKSAYQRVMKLEENGLVERLGGHRGLAVRVEPDSDVDAGPRPGQVPILGRVAAGAPTLAVENIDGYTTLPDMFGETQGLFLLRVGGDSMIDDGIWDGDYVVVRSTPTVRGGEIAVGMLDDEATVKRIYFEKGRIRLQPSNELYSPIYIDRKSGDFRIAGRVIGVIRSLV